MEDEHHDDDDRSIKHGHLARRGKKGGVGGEREGGRQWEGRREGRGGGQGAGRGGGGLGGRRLGFGRVNGPKLQLRPNKPTRQLPTATQASNQINSTALVVNVFHKIPNPQNNNRMRKKTKRTTPQL